MLELLKALFKIEPGISLGQWVYDRVTQNWASIVAALGSGGVMSILAWASSLSPVEIGSILLATIIVVCVSVAAIAYINTLATKRKAEADAIQKWKNRVDTINPLDNEFTRKRLLVADLAHPVYKRISGKRLIDCELFGPANLFF